MPWNIMLERASILRFAPAGEYVEESESHFFISSVSAFSLPFPIFTTHKDFVAYAVQNPSLFRKHIASRNIRMLIENGVPDASISRLLLMHRRVFYANDLVKVVEELKDLGIKPSHSYFPIALHAKTSITEPLWEEKVDAFKKWGWSDEDALEAFRKFPRCRLISVDKINRVMNFWVNQLGWDAMAIAKAPKVLGDSMERRIIPRASVVQYLLKKDLRKKKASLTTPFNIVDKTFIDKYIKPFKEDSCYLLKLYQEKLNLAHDKDNNAGNPTAAV